MQTMKQAASEFLTGKRVAVTGVSRTPQSHGSNVVYQRLRQRGYKVYPVNPNTDQVEGDTCYHDLKSIPGGVDWVVIGTRPETAETTIRECAELGIKRVWMHRGPGPGSVSHSAAEYGRQRGIAVIEGGCPCMFGPTGDPGHKAMRFVFTLTGNVPRRVQPTALHVGWYRCGHMPESWLSHARRAVVINQSDCGYSILQLPAKIPDVLTARVWARYDFGGDVDLAGGRYLDEEQRERFADYTAASSGMAAAMAALHAAKRVQSELLAEYDDSYAVFQLGRVPDIV